jgi:hypothetical protein
MGRTRYITGVSGVAPLIELGRAVLRRTLGAYNDVSLCRMVAYVFAQSTDDESLLAPILQPER